MNDNKSIYCLFKNWCYANNSAFNYVYSLILFCLFSLTYSSASFASITPFFYSVEKDGNVSYLLGSMHIGFSVDDLPDYALETLLKSSVLMTETDLPGLEQKSIVPRSEGVRGYMTEDGWRKLVRQLGPYLSDRELEVRSPWWISKALHATHYGENPSRARSMDLELTVKAKARGLKLVPMAPVADHLEVIKNIYPPDAVESVMLPEQTKEVKNSFKNVKMQFAKGSEDYIRGSLDNMDVDFKEALITRRNISWLPVILQQLSQGSVSIVGGALHLFGEDGLIELLKSEGFKVQRVYSYNIKKNNSCFYFFRN